MKKRFVIMALVTMSAISLAGCQTANEKQLADTMGQIDAMDKLTNQEVDIQEKLTNGEITQEEADKMSESVNSKYEESANKVLENNTSYSGMPGWAKKLGLSEAKGLKLNKATAQGDNYSLSLDYTGDYDVAAAEARRIGKDAGLKEDTSLRDSLENLIKMSGDSMPADQIAEMKDQMKVIMFSNVFSNNAKNIITIKVTPEGELSIAASSEEAIKKATHR